jgi:hypothetical protein
MNATAVEGAEVKGGRRPARGHIRISQPESFDNEEAAAPEGAPPCSARFVLCEAGLELMGHALLLSSQIALVVGRWLDDQRQLLEHLDAFLA